MDTLLEITNTTDLWNQSYDWVMANLITRSSLIQTGWLAVALLTGVLVSRLLAARFTQWHDGSSNQWVRQFIHAIRSVLAPAVAFLLMLIYPQIAEVLSVGTKFARLFHNLLGAWVIIHFLSAFIRHSLLSRWFALVVWCVAALNIFGLLEPAIEQMDALGFTLGKTHISMLTIIQALITFGVVMWGATLLGRMSEHHISQVTQLTPSLRVLIAKMVRTVFFVFAFIIGLNTLGIDLTSLAVFSGAIGVGIGFGLQKVVSNFISGIILLLDRSIKPGDVIAVNNTYGWVNQLSARHVSIITRDGKEHLIPNEQLITERVENWSYSDRNVRLKIPFAISNKADVRHALALMMEAAAETPRILKSPTPNALVTSIGGGVFNIELRAWINDPAKGISNVSSDLLLHIWDKFKAHDVPLPAPSYDVNIKTMEGVVLSGKMS